MTAKRKSSNRSKITPKTDTPESATTWLERTQKSDQILEEDQGKIAFQLLSLEILQKFLSNGAPAYEPVRFEDALYPDAPTIHWQPDDLFWHNLRADGLDDRQLLAVVVNTITSHIHHILYQSYDGRENEDFKLVLASMDESDGKLKFSLHFPKALDPRDVLQKLREPKIAECLERAIKNDFYQTTKYADFFDNLNNQTPGGYGRA
ncbi:MAG: hypothetical protein ACK5WQ_04725 [Alphaproteobacteria bacterium]